MTTKQIREKNEFRTFLTYKGDYPKVFDTIQFHIEKMVLAESEEEISSNWKDIVLILETLQDCEILDEDEFSYLVSYFYRKYKGYSKIGE